MNYNDGKVHLDIYDKSKGELIEIAKVFSEGCKELEECLLVMWENKLYTRSCCKGDHDPYKKNMKRYNYGNADILGMEGIDFFSYLSEDLISNDMVELDEVYGRQSISFYGSDKKRLINQLKNDILTGKKDNKNVLEKNKGRKITPENLQKSFISEMTINGYRETDIKRMLPLTKEIFLMEYSWNVSKITKEIVEKHELYHKELVNMLKNAYETKLLKK